MANVRFSRKEFEKEVKITPEVEEKINLFGTPIESLNATEVELEIFPNRPDLLSMHGYLRALKTYLGKRKGIKKYKTKKTNLSLTVEKTVPSQWPYAYACIIKGLTLDNEKIKEIIQVQEKLGSTLLRNRKKGGIGVYPLQKIKFPITFCGVKPSEIKFRPLEYPSEISGKQILTKHPTGKKYAGICKGWEDYPVFKDAEGKIMSMPPIINSHELGKIDETTKDVFIEVTGTDPYILGKTLVIMATTLTEMGGTIHEVTCTQKNGEETIQPQLNPQMMKINPLHVEEVLGIKLTEKEIQKYLEKMQYEYNQGKKEVQIPQWRVDVMHEADIIEDIAIAYGYNKFEPQLPERNPQASGRENPKSKYERKIAEILTGLEIQEIITYTLLRKEDLKKVEEKGWLEVESSKTEYKYIRKNLRTNALRILSENIDSEYPQRIFEIGEVFQKETEGKNSETGIAETKKLCIAITPGHFTETKQILDYLTKNIGLNYTLEHTNKKPFISGRCGKILINERNVGVIGEIHPRTLHNLKIKMPVSIIEINLDRIHEVLGN